MKFCLKQGLRVGVGSRWIFKGKESGVGKVGESESGVGSQKFLKFVTMKESGVGRFLGESESEKLGSRSRESESENSVNRLPSPALTHLSRITQLLRTPCKDARAGSRNPCVQKFKKS